uniref:Ubiquitin carboxyl-terminal hydrolase 34 n=1 Tax=Aceria tosichella TaxID=561515 RepID=A0A6G1SL13_9ACAR
MTTTPPDKSTISTTLKATISKQKTTPTLEPNDVTEDNQSEFLYDALDKLNPEKNDLNQVPKEITSSILTTRLRGVCRINRLIDYANDLCHSFAEFGSKERYQECIEELRDWILEKKIIEHIFGPNCHVEIIKQSHTILSFVAHSLDDEHVNVIWSASLLKHCGRQVLDLLTSLVRYMRTGPVLHLYLLVKNLNIEEHTEHTLLLTSCILRFIWLHSPCINQVHFCSLQKNRPQQGTSPNDDGDDEQNNSPQDEPMDQDITCKNRYSPTIFTNRKFSRRQSHQEQLMNRKIGENSLNSSSEENKQPHFVSAYDNNTTIASTTGSTANTTSTTTSTNEFSYTYGKTKSEEDDIEWHNECMNQSRIGTNQFEDQSSRSASENEYEKDVQQSLLDAIKSATGQRAAVNQHHQKRLNSPVGETLAKGGGGDNHQPADDVKQSVVDHILRSISAPNAKSGHTSSQQGQSIIDGNLEPADSSQCDLEADADNREWLQPWKGENDPFLEYTSDVSACCSEDKNMDDFDDDAQGFIQDENTNGTENPSANSSSSDIYMQEVVSRRNKGPLRDVFRTFEREPLESTSSNRGESSSKQHPSLDPHTEQFKQLSAETVAHFMELKKASLNLSSITNQICSDEDLKKLSEYNLANLSDPGKTLLWDLLQDGKIEHLGSNLYVEIENALVNLVMSFGDRFIRYKFIEACLENLSLGHSVIISLRLLPRFMSFNSVARTLSIPAVNETYTIVLWAEREHNMSKNFFKNLVEYYNERKKLIARRCEQVSPSEQSENIKRFEDFDGCMEKPFFTHIDAIITRMTFLSFIYSKPFSPVTMKLNQEQMDQLWDCLTSDDNSRCSDVLFQWIYQQAVGDDFHGVDDDLLDYVLKCKLPTLPPQHFRIRGLKLLEQLLWIRQDYECCHELEHPATRLLWDIGIKSVDDEVGMAAIRILNHFYIYTNHSKPVLCKQGTNFMRYCMEHLHSSMFALKSTDETEKISQSLETMQKVILLMRTHLEVFKAHWSFYLRILQLNNEGDLMSHRLRAYDIKLTMTIRLVIQAASSTNKTTLEVQANDFIGELRAEIVKWWYSQVDRSYHESIAPSPSSSSPSSESPGLVDSEKSETNENGNQPGNFRRGKHRLNSFTTFLLNNPHQLRLLSQNQEIPFEWDERQINELDFKDLQVIYVLNDAKPQNTDSADDLESEKSEESLQGINFPDLNTIPSIVLLNESNFERLMEVDKFLGLFRCQESTELTNKAKTLSRRVWEIIQILPTSPHYKESLKHCGLDDETDISLKVPKCLNLLNADCPQRLLYSLQIIDILKSSHDCPYWGSTFIRKGGLADLYDVFMSQKLLPEDNEEWNEWLQECLAYLLKLLFQFGTRANNPINPPDQSSSSGLQGKNMTHIRSQSGSVSAPLTSTKRVRRNRGRLHGVTEERVLIPHFSEELLRLLEDTDLIFNKLIRILESSAMSKRHNDHFYYTTMSSRAMIVHHVMSFLSSWCKSDPKFPEFRVAKFENLLKALILDDTDPSTRREACNGFYKLHYASITRSLETVELNASVSPETSSVGESHSDTSSITIDSNHQLPNLQFSADLLSCLIKFLPIAEGMRPPKPMRNCISESDYIREMNLPGCKDYFWLTCRLIEAPNTCSLSHRRRRRTPSRSSDHDRVNDREQPMDTEGGGTDKLDESSSGQANTSRDESSNNNSSLVDLQDLCKYLVVAIRKRPVFETRDYTIEDDTLRGMLMMMVMAIRRDPRFRYTEDAELFILELYCYLFAPPTEQYRYLPKCKSGATRSTAFDLMIALVEQCPKNYMRLLDLLIHDQHLAVVKNSHPTDYWPHDDCRSEVGFVGLINLGATCYLATCMQHLFMIPDLRYAILSVQDPKSLRHGDIMKELQKIFAFMLESERKAYNPRNFCKAYTMDNHPLNIAEQTDMTEFLTDLITKIEESSPVLRQIIKSLFSGTLSNNVVSLDCPHISRTTEEFYTLRVQVADMRNLNDSLDELTVKDTLEGDNMYTCSTCEKKVRAEKRACIVKLPRILCFNTMRYTFNMTTMTKEKVNTHFSFPLRLDMADYLESNLMKRQQASPNSSNCPSRNSSTSLSSNIESSKSVEVKVDQTSPQAIEKEYSGGADRADKINNPNAASSNNEPESDTMYELIGVTVHTGNADGGHYYCFIRDCEDNSTDKPRWYLFNDAEVKPFDDSHIGTECYGGELTTKSYDAINDRFMDFSIEKTNSAYMLFYKRVDYKYRSRSVALRYLESDTQRNKTMPQNSAGKMNNLVSSLRISNRCPSEQENHLASMSDTSELSYETEIEAAANRYNSIFSEMHDFEKLFHLNYEDFVLPRHLSSWIWNENLKFSRDLCIFEHNYFDFMWQICANVPRTLNQSPKAFPNANLRNPNHFMVSENRLAIEIMHLAIVFVLGVLINSREKPNLGNWTELIRKQFNSSQAACDWAMQLIDDEDSWLKQMLMKCPIEMVKQLFQRVYNDLTGSKQHKKIRLVK